MDQQVSDGFEHIPGSVLITGATGFVGTGVLHALGRDGVNPPSGPFASTRILSLERSPGGARPGVEPVQGDVTAPGSLAGKLDGIETLIHLVGIIEERGGITFDSVIRQGTENVLAEAQRAGVRHFIQMSALGAQDDPSYPYFQAKFRAEQAVKASGLTFTIFRPSIIFGEGDGFISVLAGVVRSFPLIPVVGDGRAKFQPLSIGDIGACFAHVVANPVASTSQTYELGGGKTYTYEELLNVLASALGKRQPKVHIPVPLMKAVVRLAGPLPKTLKPPVTMEQLRMLAVDNCTQHSATARLAGHEPMALEEGLSYIQPRR